MRDDSTCSFPECERPRIANGFCVGHYRQHWLGKEMRHLRKLKPRGQPHPTCSFPGCLNGGRKKNGLCQAHYSQSKKGQSLVPVHTKKRRPGTPPRIICDEVMCPVPGLIGPCHIFRGGKSDGYGSVGIENGGGMTSVHCYIWEKENGEIPDGLVIDHQCRVRACCNVDHLRVVTQQVNVTENIVGASWQKNLAKTHCPQGHPYDEANTHVNKKGSRMCRQCMRIHCREWYAKADGAAKKRAARARNAVVPT